MITLFHRMTTSTEAANEDIVGGGSFVTPNQKKELVKQEQWDQHFDVYGKGPTMYRTQGSIFWFDRLTNQVNHRTPVNCVLECRDTAAHSQRTARGLQGRNVDGVQRGSA